MTLDFLALDERATEALMRRLFGTPSAPVRPSTTPLPPLPRPAPARRAGTTVKPVGIGDRVQMRSDRREGIVIRMDGEQCLVLFGFGENVWAGRGEFVRA